MKVVVLYEELAGYVLSCFEYLSKIHHIEVHLFRKSVNNEAPFHFNASTINIYLRSDFSDYQLSLKVDEINPDAIFCCGWIYKPYLNICKKYKPFIPVILAMDNKWESTLKQKLAVLIAPFTLNKYYSRCFVPGLSQKKYAQKLGFKICKTGLYCCDTNYFNNVFQLSFKTKQTQFPKRFIYVGRYVEHKGIKQLWNAFIELYEEGKTKEWELWCVGTGDVLPVEHPAIKHFGFIQPSALEKFMAETGVFVLPSFVEPWGVVVHEFATAGFPLLCSTSVGAKEAFLIEGENGFSFDVDKNNQLKSKLLAFMMLDQDQLKKMSIQSNSIAQSNTLEIWSNKLLELM